MQRYTIRFSLFLIVCLFVFILHRCGEFIRVTCIQYNNTFTHSFILLSRKKFMYIDIEPPVKSIIIGHSGKASVVILLLRLEISSDLIVQHHCQAWFNCRDSTVRVIQLPSFVPVSYIHKNNPQQISQSLSSPKPSWHSLAVCSFSLALPHTIFCYWSSLEFLDEANSL